MPNVRLPLSGSVMQTINPWNWFLETVGNQVGLININLGRSADPELEEKILNEVGSYGRQLGRIGEALGVLLDNVHMDELNDDDQMKLLAFKIQLREIEHLKSTT